MHLLDRFLTKTVHAACVALLVLTATPSQAVTPLAPTPLFLSVVVPPNLIVTLDDSGSMARAYVPEISDDNNYGTRWYKSSKGNPLYYNPEVKYPQAKNAAGTNQTTTFAAAWQNGFYQASGTSRNLLTAYRPTRELELQTNRSGAGVTSESFALHHPTDVRCRNSSGRRCELRNPASSSPSGWTRYTGLSCSSSDDECEDEQMGAYYYVFNNTSSNPNNASCTGSDTQKTKDNDCYVIRHVTSTSGPGVVDLDGDGNVFNASTSTPVDAGDQDERQNFANWYSFARTRNLTTATAASLAFSTLAPTVRIAWQGLNTCHNSATNFVDTDCDGWRNNLSGISNAIGEFGSGASGTKKAGFYTWLFQQPTNDTTPLPTAMKRAGEYFTRTGENNPYDNNFSTSASGQLSCRRNYHILMTDGLWNDAETSAASDGATDGLPLEAPGGISQYTPITPYMDSTDNTLADMAFSYWINDLTALGNDVPAIMVDQTKTAIENYWNPKNDPARWQHMVNFTIGLGLTQSLRAAGLTWNGDMYGGSYTQIKEGSVSWPAADDDSGPENAGDLWHAAINSRGRFFSADNPTQMASAFRDALEAVTGNSGSATSLSTNSTSIQPGTTVVYQAKFSPDWTGSLLALPVGDRGAVGEQLWDAGDRIPAPVDRKIFTFNATTRVGVEFLADPGCTSSFDTNQRNWLNFNIISRGGDAKCADRVNWIRGSHAMELQNNDPGAHLRNRTGVMGDIINSDPAYVQNTNYGYATFPAVTGSGTYGAFVTANATRTPMVYVGANDGQLHAFNADTTRPAPPATESPLPAGVEQFAYIPNGVFSENLSLLTHPNYLHKYFVDGAITVGDAYLGGAWKTMLVAGLNAGGKSIYALDITDPASFGAASVKWEYTEVDLGNTYSQPQIGVLESGEWVAIFGNGYNSRGGAGGGGGAYLYVVNLNSGAMIKKIPVRDTAPYVVTTPIATCDASQTTLCDENNGLSTPALYDANENGLIDTVYVGDLLGNMWKIDLRSTSSDDWNVAFGAPLFAAGRTQPITSQPKVTAHPLGGQIVVFGTGRYLNIADVNNTDIQSYYGIRDYGITPVSGRGVLQGQSIDYTATFRGLNVRSTTENTVNYAGGRRGWYLDFPAGERVTSAPLIKVGRVIFVSIAPSTDPCVPGGTSWLMELEAINGGGFPEAILDLNGDGFFNAADMPLDGQVVSGVMTPGLGISKTPVWIEGYKVRTGTGGGFDTQRNKLCGGIGLPPCALPTCEELGNCPVENPAGTVSRKYWIQIR